MIRLIIISVAALVAGCTSPAIEIESAHGWGRLEARVGGEPLIVQLETQTISGEDGSADVLCPSYDVELSGARVSGLSPRAPAPCSSLDIEERELSWERLSGPVILFVFKILSAAM